MSTLETPGEICEVADGSYTLVLPRKQLLKPPDFQVQARMFVSPILVSS